MMKKSLLICILGLVSGIYAQETTRFMVVADPHNNSPVQNFKNTILFEIILAAIDEEVDFIFFPGDLVIRGFGEYAEKDSVLKDWQFVLDTLHTHDIRVFACRGNNDLASRESWDSLFSGPYAFPQNGPENEKNITYALEYNNILFITLDQYMLSHRINQNWLDSILVSNKKPHIFAAGHEPAFKLLNIGCMGNYPEERNVFWESLLKAKAKIYFSGHNHFYDHSIINDGDDNSFNDIHQVVVGTASSLHRNGTFDGDNGRWTPDSIFHEETNGYVLVEVTGSEVFITWKHRTESYEFEDGGDTFSLITGIKANRHKNESYFLSQNHPNPFNPITQISFSLPRAEQVILEVYNTLGQRIETLINRQMPVGSHDVTFNASTLPSGIYYYRIKADDFIQVKKMILLR